MTPAAPPWWTSAVVYQVYPRSFADSDGDGIGDLRGIIEHLDHLAGSASTWSGCRPVYPSPQDDNGYDISDYQDIDPLFGTLADFDALLAGAARARHEAGHGPGRQPHLATSTPGSSSPARRGTTRSATGTGGGRPREGMAAGTPGAEPTNWGVVLLRPGLGVRRGDRRVLPAPVLRASSPTSTGRTPQVRQAVYAMMRWWLDRGRRRLPDGRHQHDLQGSPALPARRPRRRPARRRSADGSPYYIVRPADPRVPAEMHREVFAGRRRRCSPSARCPASPSRRPGCSPTRPAPRSTWCSSSSTSGSTTAPSKWDLRPLRAARPQGLLRPLAGRAGRRRLEQPLLGQPRPAAGRLPLRRRRRAPGRGRRRCSPRCCTCTAARRTSTRARSSA